jgi:hypothetical protein
MITKRFLAEYYGVGVLFSFAVAKMYLYFLVAYIQYWLEKIQVYCLTLGL